MTASSLNVYLDDDGMYYTVGGTSMASCRNSTGNIQYTM